MANISQEEARKELARRELAKRQSNKTVSQKVRDTVSSVSKKTEESLPGAGQITGGVIGSVLGASVGMPARGSIVGGTVGRTAGNLSKELVSEFKKNPSATLSAIVKDYALQGPTGMTYGIFKRMTPAEKKQLGGETLKALGAETATAGAFSALSGAGKGALKALIGNRVAERGLESGFSKLLDPKFYKDRIDKAVATKVGNFFKNLNKTTGGQVSDAVASKSNVKVISNDLINASKNILSKHGAESIEDLADATTSNAQIKLVKEVEGMINSLGSKKDVSVPELWDIRKKMDNIIFSKKWSQGVEDYLFDLRKVFNEPIKNSGDDVVKAFGRYEFVKQQEKELGKKLNVFQLKGQGDETVETFAPKVETFAQSILGVGKDETVRTLKQLDSFVNADNRIVNDLLDTAAAESLEKNVELMGFASRGILGAFGGRKAIAQGAAALQTPVARTIGQTTQRTTPTLITNIMSQGQQ